MNKIISGEYERGIIDNSLKINSWRKPFTLDTNTVSKVVVMNQDERKSLSSAIGRGVVGSALLGPIGLVGGAISGKNKKSYLVKIYYPNGRSSVVEVNNKVFKQMQLKLKVVM